MKRGQGKGITLFGYLLIIGCCFSVSLPCFMFPLCWVSCPRPSSGFQGWRDKHAPCCLLFPLRWPGCHLERFISDPKYMPMLSYSECSQEPQNGIQTCLAPCWRGKEHASLMNVEHYTVTAEEIPVSPFPALKPATGSAMQFGASSVYRLLVLPDEIRNLGTGWHFQQQLLRCHIHCGEHWSLSAKPQGKTIFHYEACLVGWKTISGEARNLKIDCTKTLIMRGNQKETTEKGKGV